MPPTSGQLVEITDVFEEPLRLAGASGDVWVFGYGSLMWVPDFGYRLAVRARLQGWHRRFTCLSVKAWGTEARPGLSACLHPGGSVLGVAFALAPDQQEKSLGLLDRREAAYRRISVTCQLGEGQCVEGLAHVVNPGNGRFLEDPGVTEQIKLIRQGEGPKGTSLYYLDRTVACLDQLGSGRTRAHDLLDRVRNQPHVALTNVSNRALPG